MTNLPPPAALRVIDVDLDRLGQDSVLADAPDLPTATATVRALHRAFHDQLDANGEGGASTVQRLAVVTPTGQQLHYSVVNGLRPPPAA